MQKIYYTFKTFAVLGSDRSLAHALRERILLQNGNYFTQYLEIQNSDRSLAHALRERILLQNGTYLLFQMEKI